MVADGRGGREGWGKVEPARSVADVEDVEGTVMSRDEDDGTSEGQGSRNGS